MALRRYEPPIHRAYIPTLGTLGEPVDVTLTLDSGRLVLDGVCILEGVQQGKHGAFAVELNTLKLCHSMVEAE